jgi:hypothetical protein
MYVLNKQNHIACPYAKQLLVAVHYLNLWLIYRMFYPLYNFYRLITQRS